MSYITVKGRRTSHKTQVLSGCHYWQQVRPDKDRVTSERKPRGCSVCDECQRLEKKARLGIKTK